MVEGKIVHITDVLADPELHVYGRAEGGRFPHACLAFRCLREGMPIGVISLESARPYSRSRRKQIELVTTFADQAVIAIENVRLFDERAGAHARR